MNYEKCSICGAEYGLHKSETNKCPVNGREETREGYKQKWDNTYFTPFNNVSSLPIGVKDIDISEFASTIYDKWAVIIDERRIMTRDLFTLAIQDIIKPI